MFNNHQMHCSSIIAESVIAKSHVKHHLWSLPSSSEGITLQLQQPCYLSRSSTLTKPTNHADAWVDLLLFTYVHVYIGVARIKNRCGQRWTNEVNDHKHFWFYLCGFKNKELCIKNVYI